MDSIRPTLPVSVSFQRVLIDLVVWCLISNIRASCVLLLNFLIMKLYRSNHADDEAIST